MLEVTFTPPVFAEYQPSNAYPSFAGVGNEPYVSERYAVLLPGVTVPPFALRVTVIDCFPLLT